MGRTEVYYNTGKFGGYKEQTLTFVAKDYFEKHHHLDFFYDDAVSHDVSTIFEIEGFDMLDFNLIALRRYITIDREVCVSEDDVVSLMDTHGYSFIKKEDLLFEESQE